MGYSVLSSPRAAMRSVPSKMVIVLLLLSLFSTFSVAKPGFQLIETEDEAGDEVEEVEEGSGDLPMEGGSGEPPVDIDEPPAPPPEDDEGRDDEDMLENRVMTK